MGRQLEGVATGASRSDDAEQANVTGAIGVSFGQGPMSTGHGTLSLAGGGCETNLGAA